MTTMNLRKQFADYFPTLIEACDKIACDNGLPETHWEMDERWAVELRALEAGCVLLETLPPSEDFADDEDATALDDFCVGEFSNQLRLIEEHDLLRLSYFLNCFFGEADYVPPGEEVAS